MYFKRGAKIKFIYDFGFTIYEFRFWFNKLTEN